MTTHVADRTTSPRAANSPAFRTARLVGRSPLPADGLARAEEPCMKPGQRPDGEREDCLIDRPRISERTAATARADKDMPALPKPVTNKAVEPHGRKQDHEESGLKDELGDASERVETRQIRVQQPKPGQIRSHGHKQEDPHHGRGDEALPALPEDNGVDGQQKTRRHSRKGTSPTGTSVPSRGNERCRRKRRERPR